MAMFISGSKRTLLVAAVMLCVAVGVFLAAQSHRPRIRNLDSRFYVLNVTATRGTNQVLYIDSQVRGTVKDKLASLGLRLKPSTKVTLGSGAAALWLSVRYTTQLTPQENVAIEAELVNNAGKAVKLDVKSYVPDRDGKHHLASWVIDFKNPSLDANAAYTLRIQQPGEGAKLAEVELGRLREGF